jgi:hypothetical protein
MIKKRVVDHFVKNTYGILTFFKYEPRGLWLGRGSIGGDEKMD